MLKKLFGLFYKVTHLVKLLYKLTHLVELLYKMNFQYRN